MIVELSEDDQDLIDEFNDSIGGSPWVTFEDSMIFSYGYTDNDKLLGAIQIEEWSNGVLGISIATHPDHRREKIASKLIQFVIETFTDAGYHGPLLMIIDESNTASIELSKSLGFKKLQECNSIDVEVYVKQVN